MSRRGGAGGGGPARKHDLMAQYIAVRNGVLQQEQESRIEIKRFFEQFTKDIQAFEERRNVKRAGQMKKNAVQAEIVRHRVRALRDVLLEEEDEARLQVATLECRMRRSLQRLFDYEHYCVQLAEKENRLRKHEAAKRFIVESNQIQEINEILTTFGRTAWKPKLRVLGTCPFHKRDECPFAAGACHGMTVGTLHQAHLVAREQQLQQQQQDQATTTTTATTMAASLRSNNNNNNSSSLFQQLTGHAENKSDKLIAADFISDIGLPLSPPRGTQGRTVVAAAGEAMAAYGETLTYQAHCMEYDIDSIPVDMLR